MKNYYDILEISNESDSDTIKKAYRQLSLKHHPDRGGDAEKFKEISEAYEILGDNEKRIQYDMMNNGMPMGMPFPFPPNQHMPGQPPGGLGDIFNMMFGGGPINIPGNLGANVHVFHNGIPVNINGGVNGPTFNSLNKPEPIIKQIEISLTMAYSGCKIPIPIERTIIQNNVNKKENETIYVDVPPGIDDDEAIVIPEKGNILIINQEIKGDIKLFFKIKNNTDFIRNGLDLIYNKEISLKDALCGFSFEMKYINNKNIKIVNNSGNIVTPNYEKKIPKAGIKRDNHIGDLIIKFNIKFPDNLTDEQINKLGDIL